MPIIKCNECGGQVSTAAPRCPHCGHLNSGALDGNELYDVTKVKVAEEIQGQLLNWLKRRTWLAALVITVIGVFGINALVTVSVYSFLKKDIMDAAGTAAVARQTVKDANQVLQETGKVADKLKDNMTLNFAKLSSELNNRLVQLEADARHWQIYSEQEYANINERIQDLDSLIKVIAEKERTERQKIIREYEQFKNSADDKNKSLIKFKDNARYFVQVTSGIIESNAATKVIAELSKRGYRAGFLETNENLPKSAMVIYPEHKDTKSKVDEIKNIVFKIIGASVSLSESPMGKFSVSDTQTIVILPEKQIKRDNLNSEEPVLSPTWIVRNQPYAILDNQVFLTVTNVGDWFKGVHLSLTTKKDQELLLKTTLKPGRKTNFEYNRKRYVLMVHDSKSSNPEKAKISIK